MRMSPSIVAAALASLASTAQAQLLISPDSVTSRHASTDVMGTNPPSGAGDLGLSFSPTAFANSNSHSASSTTTGNEVRRSSSYDTVFFFQFPTGEINTAHVKGKAEALSRVGATTAQNITATATSTTRMLFDVTNPVNYHFFGSISLTNVAGTGPGFGSALAEMYLYRNSTIIQAFSITTYTNGTVPFNLSGLLQTGAYRIEAQAGASGTATGLNALWSSTANYDGQMDFTPVPAPGSLSILTLAALTLTRRRRGT